MSDGKEVKRWYLWYDIANRNQQVNKKPHPNRNHVEVISVDDHDRIVAEQNAEQKLLVTKVIDLSRYVDELRTKLDVEQFAHEHDVNQLNERVESLTKKLSNALAEVAELKEGNYAFSEQIAKQRYTIAELRAEIERLKQEQVKYKADCKRIEYFDELHDKLATQARLIEKLRGQRDAWRRQIHREDVFDKTLRESDELELAAIEKEGAKDES